MGLDWKTGYAPEMGDGHWGLDGGIKAVEERYLSTLMCDPSLIEDNRIEPEDFYVKNHGDMLRCILELYENGKDPTPAAVGFLGETRFGFTFEDTLDLTSNVFPQFVLHPLTRRIKLAAANRRMKRACDDLSLAPSGETAVAAREYVEKVSGEIAALESEEVSRHAGDITREGVSELLRASMQTRRVVTGVPAIDEEIGFLSAGDLCIVGAATGVGKSSFMLFSALKNSESGLRTGIISIEDSEVTWGSRILGYKAQINPKVIRATGVPVGSQQSIKDAIAWARSLHVYIDVAIGATLGEVFASMSRLVRHDGCEAIAVDYIHAIRSEESSHSRRDEIRIMSSELKREAKRLGVPLILACQLRRRDKPDEFPTIHDLKEAGDLENAAEAIVLLAQSEEGGVRCALSKNKWGGSAKHTLRRTRTGALDLGVDSNLDSSDLWGV